MTQNNGARGEKIGHKASGDPLLCPKTALLWCFLHLRYHETYPSTPQDHVITPQGRWNNIMPTMISNTLKTTVMFCGPKMGFEAKDFSDRSLCTSVVMEILCAVVYNNIIKMIRHWRSDEIPRYLHVQAGTLMRDFSNIILTHGNYYLLPQQEAPCF